MFLQHRLDRLPITFGRRYDPPGAQHRLTDEGRNRVGALAFDQRLQFGRAMGYELLFALVQIVRRK